MIPHHVKQGVAEPRASSEREMHLLHTAHARGVYRGEFTEHQPGFVRKPNIALLVKVSRGCLTSQPCLHERIHQIDIYTAVLPILYFEHAGSHDRCLKIPKRRR